MKLSAPFLLIVVPLVAIPMWFATGRFGLSHLHPFDKSLNGMEHMFLNDFVFSLALLSFIGIATLRTAIRSKRPRLDFLAGVIVGVTVFLFFQQLTTFTVQAINAAFARNAATVTAIGQLRDTANDLRLLFATAFLGYLCWRARDLLLGAALPSTTQRLQESPERT